MSATPISGRFAQINGIYSVRQWQANDNGTLAMFVNSGTRIGHGRRKGITSWGGGYNAHGAVPAVYPGDEFFFEGYTGPDTGIGGEAGQKYSGNAFCSSVQINWDWTSGNVLEHQVAFEGSLVLARAAGYPPSDLLDISDPEEVGPTKIEYSSDGSDWTEILNVAQAQVTMQNAIQNYVNSSTSSRTGRAAGIFDCGASLTIQDNELGSGLVKGDAYQFRFYINPTDFFLFKWLRVQEFTGLQPSAETGAIIQHQIPLAMAGVENVATVPTIGHVLAPDGATYIWGQP